MKIFMIMLMLVASVPFANESKYKIGDCITPTDKSYSWFGYFAKVTGIETGADLLDGNTLMYLLNFRDYDTQSNKYVAKAIEPSTKVVDKVFCKTK